MKTPLLRLFVCSGVLLLTVGTALARRHTPPYTAPADVPATDPKPLPEEPPVTINPDAAPSLSLQPFMDAHLDKILAPLGTRAFAQSDLVAGVRDGYAKALPTATDARKPAYQLAIAVCDAMINAIAERQKAAQAMNDSYQMRSSEAIQPRGGRQAVKDQDKDENFFYNSQKNTWLQNAAALRQQVATLYRRERAAETQAGGPWVPPTVAPPAPEPAPLAAAAPAGAPTPSVSVPAPVVDPIVGNWSLNGFVDMSLKANHTFSSKNSGTWLLTSETDGKRHYEFHYDKHRDWINSMTLSDDGRSLEGADRYGKYVYAQRR